MKLFKYIHLLADGKSVPIDKPYKEPFVWSELNVLDQYIEVTGFELENYLIDKESKEYYERKKQGEEYSNIMNARLVLLRKKLPASLSGLVCSRIREITNSVRIELSAGLWFSAYDEAQGMQESEELQGIIDNYNLPINQAGLIQEIKDRINKAIAELY